MPSRRPPSHSRRRYLRTGALLAAGLLAGCAGDEPTVGAPGTTGETPTAEPTDTATTTDTATPTDTETATATPDPTSTPPPAHEGYEMTEVRATTPGGDRLGAVTAAIADTHSLRYEGLSSTEALPEDRGMLFVYGDVGDRTFVMREMDFGIDIVYADDEGVVTEIHHAPAPGPDEDGGDQRYPGRGQYVLEVNYEWTEARDVEAGDVLEFEL